MYLVSCTNTHCDATDSVNHRMVKNTKTWISWEWNIIFLRNKNFFNLCLRWHILRSYRFVAEVTFKNFVCKMGAKFAEPPSSLGKKGSSDFTTVSMSVGQRVFSQTAHRIFLKFLKKLGCLKQCWTQNIFGDTVYLCYCKFRLVTPHCGGWGDENFLFWQP